MKCTDNQQKRYKDSNSRNSNNRNSNSRNSNNRNNMNRSSARNRNNYNDGSAGRRNYKAVQRRRKRNRQRAGCFTLIFAAFCVTAVFIYIFKQAAAKPEYQAAEYEASAYNRPVYREEHLYADELCVAAEDVSRDGVSHLSGIHSAALFDVSGKKVDFSYSIHDRLYPASTTKILTALVAIKNGSLDDVVTVSENAAASSFLADEQTCGLKTGDQLTLRDLLYGLLLYSGNDNATAIAEHIAGNMEAFADMMNAQAAELMATNSHFVNSNGLHDEEHYTTAYDLYLIFNECIRHQEFLDIIGADSYTAHITEVDGNSSEMEVKPTNYYASGEAALPTGGATVIGGKTGTTNEAGNCLILLDRDTEQNPYISIVMGADTKEILYEEMTAIIDSITVNGN